MKKARQALALRLREIIFLTKVQIIAQPFEVSRLLRFGDRFVAQKGFKLRMKNSPKLSIVTSGVLDRKKKISREKKLVKQL